MDVAVVGATGAVGETIVHVLEERKLPVGTLRPLASRSQHAAVRFRGRALDVHPASTEQLRDADVVFFAGGEDASALYAPAILERGGVVIDNSPAFRMRDGVPLIVPDVNGDAVSAADRLFPVANCTAIILASALRVIRDAAGLGSVWVATYQAASGAGRAGLEELEAQERAVLDELADPTPGVFPRVLARNVVPQVGTLDSLGWTSEERKICEETRKMLSMPHLKLRATAVRVPVRTAHSAAVVFETRDETTVAHLADAFAAGSGIVFHASGIVTPREVEGGDAVHVARLRSFDEVYPERSRGTTAFAMWVVGDQLRKGAATTAVQILELLLAKGYLTA
ncbi:MAG: aspartate-semialdehyde dehydrogenase [Candidatus Eremiobacteraeota bacterium]|nr:aspartate-semialdehyde dehydrogenase [Candidatus Eremiobacteraeota bacterium]MBV9700248.1 aspartate-semialdehyde dehydrogenase [Candidatus Eremiobacteraeota bacterium]